MLSQGSGYWGQARVWVLLAPGKVLRGSKMVSQAVVMLGDYGAGLPGESQCFRQA